MEPEEENKSMCRGTAHAQGTGMGLRGFLRGELEPGEWGAFKGLWLGTRQSDLHFRKISPEAESKSLLEGSDSAI